MRGQGDRHGLHLQLAQGARGRGRIGGKDGPAGPGAHHRPRAFGLLGRNILWPGLTWPDWRLRHVHTRVPEARHPVRECDRRNPGSLPRGDAAIRREGAVCSDSTGCPWVFDDPDPGPTFRPGHVVKDPPFRCRVLDRAIKCTLIESGRGFLINTEEARRIGPTPGAGSSTDAGPQKLPRRRA